MSPEVSKYTAAIVSSYIELFAIILIAITIIIVLFNNFMYIIKRDEVSFTKWKDRSWKGIQGGLDLLVAADLLSTITIDRTLQSVITLGILLLIRTVISWSIEMDAHGCWPWQRKAFELKEKLSNNTK
jgi:uncharacterized membrane protein